MPQIKLEIKHFFEFSVPLLHFDRRIRTFRFPKPNYHLKIVGIYADNVFAISLYSFKFEFCPWI